MKEPFKVLFLSSEVSSFAKAGGLADVASALPGALKRLGVDVRLVMPFYRVVKRGGFLAETLLERLSIPHGELLLDADIFETQAQNQVPLYLIQKEEFYDRENLYGTPKGDYVDNLERFSFLAHGALRIAEALSFLPNIIHCNDWQTGLVPALLKGPYLKSSLGNTRTVFTIHNIAYQGMFRREKLNLTGLPPEMYNPEGIEFWGRINFMKAGIVYADVITTVSRKYSEEIQTPEYGYGLEGILRKRREDLYGIVNGVDYEEWDPSRDPHLITHYSLKDLSGKRENKKDLLKELSLPLSLEKVPLLGMISRFADQKGFDILAEILDELFTLDIGFVLLGTGEQKYHDFFRQVALNHPHKAGIRIGYDDRLAHKIIAGADLFLMPSKYEPCGLSQMYSLKYGTVPIVRATGGLDDTVEVFDAQSGRGNGFKFVHYAPGEFLAAIRQAIEVFKDSKQWEQLVANGMKVDFSWDQSAKRYYELYRFLDDRTMPLPSSSEDGSKS